MKHNNSSQRRNTERSTELLDAERRLSSIIADNPWMRPESMKRMAAEILSMNANPVRKLAKLTELAKKVDQTLRPHYSCTNGCCNCCSMFTPIYRHEAVRLSQTANMAMFEVPFRSYSKVLIPDDFLYVKQCPFLVDGHCSVYNDRPMICLLHHSLLNPIRCNRLANPPGSSYLFAYDIDLIELPYHIIARSIKPREPWGGITEFFPSR